VSSDNEFPFRVGRLIGSCEMAGHMLLESTDPEQQMYGNLILDRVVWFADDKEVRRRELTAAPEERQTVIKTPPLSQ